MKKVTPIFLALLLTISCQKDPINIVDEANSNCTDCNIEITKDASRLELFDSNVNIIKSTYSKSSKIVADTIDLVLKAKLNPLIVNYNGREVLLNANHVAVRSNRVAVSYSIVGEPYGGAIDIIDIPKNKNVTLEGTLLIPDKDIDAVDFDSRTRLMFGGGLNVDLFPNANSSSFFEYYSLKSQTKNPKDFNLKKLFSFTERFGNKLNSIKDLSGTLIGSGGGNDGTIFIYNKKEKKVFLDQSNLMSGLFIFDTSVTKQNGNNVFIAVAYNNNSKELKAFYYDINSKTSDLSFKYEVSLGNWNLNVEAKHSIMAPKSNVLIVSLEQEGIGVFKLQETNGIENASLVQQVKDEILDPNNPDEVVNSFSYYKRVVYAAAGAGGILILPYSNKRLKLSYEYKVEVLGESVNSILRKNDNLVVGSTSGVWIFKMSKKN